jgi:hypothetical protein
VTVVVELRARFDEEANLNFADRLQQAGVQVVYGVVGYKTHAKMLLIVRREGRKLRRYVHLGTGNYHAGTARAYTDIGMITADADIGADVHQIFQQLSGMAPAIKAQAPAAVAFHPACRGARADRTRVETCTRRQARQHHRQDELPSTSPPVVRALYAASQAGVQIELIVRGACTLRPGVPGRLRQHPRAFDRRSLPRTQPRVLVRECRRPGIVLRQRRLAGAQPAAPGRNLFPDHRPPPRRAGQGRSLGQLPHRQPQRVGTAARRPLRQGHARRRCDAAFGSTLAARQTVRMNDTHLFARSAALPLQDGDLLAAIDLGSNSFHMVVARYVLGQLRTVDRIREMVRLAEGLDGKGGLTLEVRQRALECLSRFGQRLRDIPPQRVRAVATNTVRALAAPQTFLMPAETALGHAIEVVSGREEARLIYLGVAHAQPPKPEQLRLVIDIGGGSTECIIGSWLRRARARKPATGLRRQHPPLLRRRQAVEEALEFGADRSRRRIPAVHRCLSPSGLG